MYVYIRNYNKGDILWRELTDFVIGEIVIDDVIDGTKDTAVVNLMLNEDYTYFPYDKAIQPKLQVKISQVNNQALENELNTYWFLTADCQAKLIRKGNDEVKELYQHVVNLREYSEIASDTVLPNYTITQPKTQYFDMYTRYAFREVTLDYKFSNDGTKKTLPNSTQIEDNLIMVDDDQVVFGFDNSTSKYYVDINEVQTVGYNVLFEVKMSKTAWAKYINQYGGQEDVVVDSNLSGVGLQSRQAFIITTTYYNSSNEVVLSETREHNITFKGGIMPFDNVNGFITGFPPSLEDSVNIQVYKQSNAVRARVTIDLKQTHSEYNYNYSSHLPTNISGVPVDVRTKTIIETIRLSATSGQLQNEVTLQKDTLLRFVEKALFDYNLSRYHKLTLDPQTQVLLDVEAKEGEWEEYTLMELLERAFKYINCSYYITINNVITHIKPEKKSIVVDLKNTQSLDENIDYENHIDTIISKSKNIMSQNDFVTERILIGSIEPEFSQFTEETAGFLTSNNQYFVSNVKLYTPDFSFVLNGTTFTSNIAGKSYVWDITSRFLEQDIYKALPDVRFDTSNDVPNQKPSQRATGELGQGNTIYYKSGSNFVGGLCHMPPTIPEYNIETGSVINITAQYAVVEMLICLAYETINSIPAWQISNPTVDVEFPAIQNWELEITYCPIFEELTTKYVSNMKNRQGLNWEKKVNVSDRVISYEDNEKVLKNDMESKGNNEYSFDDTVRSLDETLRVGDIINGNYYVTSKKMVISNGVINVTYRLQENFIIENQDVGLGIKFERFAVPYDYVYREMILENHLVLSKDKKFEYLDNANIITKLLSDTYVTGNIDGALYANLRLEYEKGASKNVLMRIAKMESNFTMILTGKFIDNYGAGIQRFNGTVATLSAIFSQPYRYVDYQGKVKSIKLLGIGYTSGSPINSSRLGVLEGSTLKAYPLNRFPQSNWDNNQVELNNAYFNPIGGLELLRDKDAREAIMLNVHSFLETEDEDIKFYGFKKINKVGILNSDMVLSDDLEIGDITPYLTNIIDVVPVVGNDMGHDYIQLNISGSIYNGKNIVLLNETNSTYSIVGIIKNVFVSSNSTYIYAYGLKHGRFA